MTDQTLLTLLVALPLLGAGMSLVLSGSRTAQRVLGVLVLTAQMAVSVGILAAVQDGSTITERVGGWSPDIGIVLVADPLAGLLVVTASLMLLVVFVYALGSSFASDAVPWFHPVYLTLSAGVGLTFVAGDLFNLFVAFEVMLVSSYVLITLGGSRDQVRHGMSYVVINLLASALFLTAVGLIYAATGSVNMAVLSERLADIDPAVRNGLGLLLLVVFGIKAAIFPLFQWLPDSYPTAPAPVTAIFAGLLTKIGIYAIIRTQTLMFPSDGSSTVLLWLAALTMVVGVLGAIAQNDVKRILSFHIVSQIGYMLFGLALFTLAGLAGAVIYVIHNIVVKTTLLLVAGLLEQTRGTAQLKKLGGLLHSAPFLAALFLLPALSLAGLPPFSGFVAKLSLVQAGLAGEQFVVVGVSLFVSMLTLFSMTKIWNGVFWGSQEEPSPVQVDHGVAAVPASPAMLGATLVLVVASLGVSAVSGPLYEVSERAAVVLLERTPYVESVVGG